MLLRILQFLIGALLAGGGGYLAWTHRTSGMNVFPPEAGMPWLVIAGVFGLCAGLVFLISAVHPRPNTRARVAAKAARRDETLGAAEAYYSQRERAADSDWRSGSIPPPADPVAPPPAEPVKMVEPVRVSTPVAPVVVTPAAVAPVVIAPAPAAPASTAPVAAPTPAPPPAPAPVAKPVATSAPPELILPPLFPSTATLAPIPAATEPPPLFAPEKPPATIDKPQVVAAPKIETKTQAPAPLPPAPAAPTPLPLSTGDFTAIRAALAAENLDEAEKLLNAKRETVQGLELAELTGLAGDHAAAAGRASNAKWLWRLALKRFGELGAMDTPAAQAVSESLRIAG